MHERIDTFLNKLGQTTPFPYLIDVDRADGIYIYDKNGKSYMDMIAGVAVSNLGHNNSTINQAIKDQVDRHLHVMVYGEFIQDSQSNFAKRLTALLPENLDCVYPVNSGTEANEAALKLAKRVTGRSELISFRGSYHGSTHGSMSVSGNETKKIKFRPLIPDVRFLKHNSLEDLKQITERTAGVIIETIQGDAGVRRPTQEFIQALRDRCTETGTILIFDEVQCGMGRAGKMFAFQHFNVVPDVLVLGKALGGGMPIGAIVSSNHYMQQLSVNPLLGHITTFGGHPVVCAAADACLQEFEKIDFDEVERKAAILQEMIGDHPEIKETRRVGMMFAFDMVSFERVEKVVKSCLEKGLLSFWFLSHPYSFRLSPPLTINEDEIRNAGKIILDSINETAE